MSSDQSDKIYDVRRNLYITSMASIIFGLGTGSIDLPYYTENDSQIILDIVIYITLIMSLAYLIVYLYTLRLGKLWERGDSYYFSRRSGELITLSEEIPVQVKKFERLLKSRQSLYDNCEQHVNLMESIKILRTAVHNNNIDDQYINKIEDIIKNVGLNENGKNELDAEIETFRKLNHHIFSYKDIADTIRKDTSKYAGLYNIRRNILELWLAIATGFVAIVVLTFKLVIIICALV